MANTLVTTSGFNALPDPHPDSKVFSNVRLYNHLILHHVKATFCSIDCMTKRFTDRCTDQNRKRMRQRLTVFLRWAREEQNKLIEVARAGYGNNGHNEALAAKIFDPFTATDRDREIVASDLSRALHRKEITQEVYDKIFEIVYPLLNEPPTEEQPPCQ